MAVNLMKPREAIAQRLDHDLESVCYVLLHIVRFTTGPVGTKIGTSRKSHRVAWWHHERDVKVIKDNKVMDMAKIIKHPERYISEYWRPAVPFIKEMLKLFPTKGTPSDASMNDCYQKFRNILVRARDFCNGIDEQAFNYAAFNSTEPTESRKRARPHSLEYDLPRSKRQISLAGGQTQSSTANQSESSAFSATSS